MSIIDQEFKAFSEKFRKEIIFKAKDSEKVRFTEVMKNNGVVLHGITIVSENTIVPTVYEEWFYKKYQENESIDDLVNLLFKIIKEETPKTQINMDFFGKYSLVKDRIRYKLINKTKNKVLLNDIPHIPFMDLAICFYCYFDEEEIGKGSILIKNEHVHKWEITTEELFQDASRNTPIQLPLFCTPMIKYLQENYPEQNVCGFSDEEEIMYLVTNSEKYYGAIALFYPGELEHMAQRLQSSFYILPSSVHELIVLKDNGSHDEKYLIDMVKAVNASEVGKEEILSDYPYFYDFNDRKLRKIKV